MSHNEIENSGVDYIPDSAKEKEAPKGQPFISCENCFHKDVCYWFTQLYVLGEGMKAGKTTELPFDPKILATKCKAFITKNGVKNPTQEEKTVDPDAIDESD